MLLKIRVRRNNVCAAHGVFLQPTAQHALQLRGGGKVSQALAIRRIGEHHCAGGLLQEEGEVLAAGDGGLVDEALQASEPQMPKDDAPSAEEPCAQAADAERTIKEIPESGAERFQMEASAETAFSMAPENSEFWLSEESAEENAPTEETVLEPQKVHASDTEVPNLFDDDFAEPVRRHRKSAKERTQEADEDEYEGASPLLVIAIILLSFLVVFLVWVLVVKLMTSGILPNYDFGFARWFNAHVFELY